MGKAVSRASQRCNFMPVVPHPIFSRTMGPLSAVVPGTETASASSVYRHFQACDEEKYQLLLKSYFMKKNCVQVLEERCKHMGLRPAIAYRRLKKMERRLVRNVTGEERVFNYFHYCKRKVILYEELWHKIVSFGSGLHELGLSERSFVIIYEKTRWEWLVSIYGIWTQNMIATTFYENLGEEALIHVLSETVSAAIICNGQKLKTLLPLLSALKLRPIIVCLDGIPDDVDIQDYRVVDWNDVITSGAEAKHAVKIPTDNNTESLVMYTSGTTGNPKGVVHTHGSLVAGINALEERLTELYTSTGESETYCAFLPLAHILEFAIVNVCLKRGSLIGFGNSHTLTDNFAIPHGDFKEFAPNGVIGVPRIFDTMKKGLDAKIPPPNSFKRMIFDMAFNRRLNAIMNGKNTPFLNQYVFKEALQLLGGRTYSMLSGGGPLSEETQKFISVCFGGPLLIQGWGLTETVGCGTTQLLDHLETDDVGQPLPSVELRLLDTEEYKHTDRPEPRGEILLRGPFLFKGYYKQEKLTREAIDEDGWFHTGDIGSMTADGRLRIIGRVKALAKNVLGEYIALEALEAVYVHNPLCVPGGVCVLVHPDRPYICALVLTDETKALMFAKEHGIKGSYPDVLHNPVFQQKAVESMQTTAKTAKRKPMECVRHVRVLNDEWTPKNGLMTPTMKLKRREIDRRYADLIHELFKNE